MALEVLTRDPVVHAVTAKRENLRAAFVLSWIVVSLAAFNSILGFWHAAFSGDKTWLAMWLGNDSVTLLLTVPVLISALILARRGSARARMVWLGALYYMVYNYAFYVFGMPVSVLYLPLIAVFTFSIYALALTMGKLDVEGLGSVFGPRTPARWIAGFMFFVAFGVSRLWISQWVNFLLSGTIPQVNGDANAYKVIAAVDLSIMVSMLIPAGYLLWRRRPWGFVLAVMFCIQSILYLTVMGTVCVVEWLMAPQTKLFSGWFLNCIFGCAGTLLCLCGLMLNVKKERAAS